MSTEAICKGVKVEPAGLGFGAVGFVVGLGLVPSLGWTLSGSNGLKGLNSAKFVTLKGHIADIPFPLSVPVPETLHPEPKP